MSTEVIGSLELEFLINNPELLEQLRIAQQNAQNSTADMVTQISKVAAAASDSSNKQITEIKRLETELEIYKGLYQSTFDPALLAFYNKTINDVELSLSRLRHELEDSITPIKEVGKEGAAAFTELGNKVDDIAPKANKFQAAISRVTDISNIGARVVTQLSRQIISLGTGMLAFVIGAKAIEALGTAFAAVFEILKGGESTLELNAELAKKANDLYADQSVNVKLLVAEIQNQNTTQERQKEILSELNVISPTYFGNLKDIHDIVTKLPDDYAKFNTALLLNARVQGAQSLIIEKTKELLELQRKLTQVRAPQAGNDFFSQLAKSFQDFANIGGSIDLAKNVKANGLSGIIDPSAKAYQAQIADISKALNQLSNGIITDQQKIQANGGDIAGKGLALTQKNANNILEVQKIAIQTDLNTQQAITADQAKSLTDRQAALKKGLDDQLAIIDINEKQKLQKIGVSETDKKVIVAQANSDKLKATDDYYKNLDNLDKKGNKKDPSIDGGKNMLAAQTTLLQNIDALKQKYAAKDTERANQNLYDIDANFKKQYNEVVAYNVKRQKFIDDYNAQHKNNGGEAYANKIGLNQQDPNQLQLTEFAAVSTQADLNENAYIQTDIEKKKKLYADYEAYRLKVGDTIANNDYSDLLKSGKDFSTYLSNILDGIDNTDVSGAIAARKEIVKTNLDQTVEAQKVALEKLKEQYATYDQQREALISAAQTKILILTKAGDAAGADQVKKDLTNQLDALEENSFKTLDSYKQLFSNINTLSVAQAKQTTGNLITYYSVQFALGKISLTAYLNIVSQLYDKLRSLNDIKFDDIKAVGEALITVGTSFESINSGVADFIKGLGNIGVSVAKVGAEFSQLQTDQENGKNTFGDYANIVATGLSGIISLIGTITTAAAQRQKAETDYYNNIIDFQTQYNVALEEQIRLQYQTEQGSIFYTDTAKELNDAVKAYNDATKNYKQSLLALQAGQAIVGTKNVVNGKNVTSSAASGATAGAAIGGLIGTAIPIPVVGTVAGALGGAIIGGLVGAIGGIFGGKTKANVLAPLLQTYPQLIDANGKFNESLAKTLIATNQVDDNTKTLLNSTIAYYDEQQQAMDQITSTLKDLVGELGSNISDALTQAFENGTDAAQAFGKAVSDILSNIIQQDLFVAVFGDQLSALQQKLTGDVLTGGTNTQAAIIADIENFYKNAQALVPIYTAGLKAAQTAGNTQGLTLFQPTTTTSGSGSSATLSGQISGITADQATILEGAIHGMQLEIVDSNGKLDGIGKTMSDQLSEMRSQTLIQMQIQVNTKRSADNSDIMVGSLKNIDSNTSSTNLTNALRAAGHV